MNLQSLVKKALDGLTDKQRFIIEKRYGLMGEDPMTLEAIGNELDLTRERIRQIENAALEVLREEGHAGVLEPVVAKAVKQLESVGGIMQENMFLDEMVHLIGEEQADREKINNMLEFVFSLFELPKFSKETKKYYAARYNEKDHLKQARDFLKQLEKVSKKIGEPMDEEQFSETVELAMKKSDVSKESLATQYLCISKQFKFNPYGDFGLRKWPEIEPRGVREKAHLVLKKHGDPLHFTEISDKINEVGFDDKVAQPQTVHNELIKDKRFVLCGRGMYGLREWGLKPGTVKDVIERILNEHGPLHPQAVVDLVKEQRIVKDTTIRLGLQDKDAFKKLDDGRYHVHTA